MEYETLLKYQRQLYSKRECLNDEINQVDEELRQMEEQKIQEERLT